MLVTGQRLSQLTQLDGTRFMLLFQAIKQRRCAGVTRPEQLEQMRAERKSLVAGLKPQTYRDYERIRKKWHGTVVAEIADGRCGACQIVLRPQFFQDVRHSGELMFCESCGRFLHYNPPVSFEQDLAAHQ